MKQMMELNYPDITISISSIDRLLDGHGYTTKLSTVQPVERNRADVKEKRSQFANWLDSISPATIRVYLDETNYNIWCSKSFGRSRRGTPCVNYLPSSRGANLNILASMSATGMVYHELFPKITWQIFNALLERCSTKLKEEDPNATVVFLFDNAPVHKRAREAILCSGHSFQHLPPYSPFFNPIEEVFSKFKSLVKEWLSGRRYDIFHIATGFTIKEHRKRLLIEACEFALPKITASNCAAFDRHCFCFIEPSQMFENL
jgi:transposase